MYRGPWGEALTTLHIIAEPAPQLAQRISFPMCWSRM